MVLKFTQLRLPYRNGINHREHKGRSPPAEGKRRSKDGEGLTAKYAKYAKEFIRQDEPHAKGGASRTAKRTQRSEGIYDLRVVGGSYCDFTRCGAGATIQGYRTGEGSEQRRERKQAEPATSICEPKSNRSLTVAALFSGQAALPI